MRLKLELDPETTERLIESAAHDRRPVAWQAEVILRRGLGFLNADQTGAPPSSEEQRDG